MSHDPTNATPDQRGGALVAFVRERMSTPFAWGTNDCCIFAADWVCALTGIDPAADVRGTYDDATGALATLATLGGIDAVAARAGGAQCLPLAACVGDVGVVVHEGRELLGVCVGEQWLAPGAAGLVSFDLNAARCAWRV